MDAPTASIIAALISAIASVLVALVDKGSSSKPVAPGKVRRQYRQNPSSHKFIWFVALGILCVWLALSPVMVHGDWGGMNFFILPVVTLVLAVSFPLKPSWVASITLMLYPVNFIVGLWIPIARGERILGVNGIIVLLGMAFANALIAWGVARWRAPHFIMVGTTTSANAGTESGPGNPPTLAEQIEALRKLHEAGTLSDAEYQNAKNKLLN